MNRSVRCNSGAALFCCDGRKRSADMESNTKVEIVEFILPDHFLPALMNRDTSGMTEEEMETLNEMEEQVRSMAQEIAEKRGLQLRFYHWGDYRDAGFCRHNDLPGEAGRMGSNCHEVDLVVTLKEPEVKIEMEEPEVDHGGAGGPRI